MKKILSLLTFLFCALFASAEIDVNSTDNVVYLKNTSAQIGSSAKIQVMLKCQNTIGSVKVIFDLPEGVTIEGTPESADAFVTWNAVEKILVLGKGAPYYSTGEIASFIVNVDPSVTLGENDMKITYYSITEPSLATYTNEGDEVVSTLTVQKTAVIEPQPEDYAFEAVPTCVATGSASMSIPVNFANEGYVDNISFNIVYPDGMLTTKSGKNYNITVNKDRFDTGSDATLTVKATSGTAVSFTNGDSDLVEPGNGNLFTIPVTLTNVADGVYTIKFTDIKVSVTNDEADPISTETLPDYYVSVVVGQPSAQEAILYGKYDIPTIESFNTALKNVAAANITAINSENKGYFKDIITVDDNKKWCYYYRESEKYATTVMPYDLGVTLENQSYCTLYRVEDMTSESIVIKELSQGECIPANTPCIFKGTLSFLKENMPLNFGAIDEQPVGSTIFTGTYEATELADGEGYYISGGAFYGDHASISPFRAYFKGNVNGVKSFSVKIDTPNGLIDITDQLSDEAIYSLQGIRMSNAQKGINIKGGKKVYVK